MNIEQQLIDNHQVKLTVQVESSKLEDAKHRAARHLSQHKKIPGFRPGKAPYPIILRNFGEEAILEEALDLLVKDIYPEVIEESGVKPYGPGSLENMPKLDPLTFEFIVPLEPEVTLGDYKNIRIPYKLKAISKKEINKVLDDLRERQVVLEPSNQPAGHGDQVYIKLSIKHTHPAEGEIPALVTDRRMPVVIAEASKEDKAEWPFPGFSSHLLGVSRDADLTFNHTYPEDSKFKELRSKEVEIQVIVEEIKKRILPELTDEFAQSINEQYTDLKALTADIRKSLELQAKEGYDEEYNDKIMREIIKHAVIKYPPQMVEREIDIFIDQLGNRLAQQKMDMDTYLKIRKMDAPALRTEIKPQAEERLKRTLILLEISKLENIHVENAELESESMRTLDEIGRMLPADKTRKTMNNDFVRGVISNVGADLLVRHTWDYLQSVARGEKEEPAIEAEIAQSEQVSQTAEISQPEQTSQTAEIAEKPKKKRTAKKVETNEPK